MDIIFKEKRLKKVVNNHSKLVQKYGTECATLITRRINEIHASSTLQDLRDIYPRSRCHQLTGNRQGQFAVDLKHPLRLIFIPCEQPPPLTSDGGISLAEITCVKIIELGDYHE